MSGPHIRPMTLQRFGSHLALHSVPATCCGIQQHVHQVVVQQIHLEAAAMESVRGAVGAQDMDVFVFQPKAPGRDHRT